AIGAEIAGRFAGSDDHVVLDEEGAGRAIDVDPAGEVFAVEERLVVVLGAGGAEADGQHDCDGDDAMHETNPPDGFHYLTIRRFGLSVTQANTTSKRSHIKAQVAQCSMKRHG